MLRSRDRGSIDDEYNDKDEESQKARILYTTDKVK